MPTTWASARSLLTEGEFLSNLINYDKDNIPPRVIQNLKKYIFNPQFDVAKIEKVSVAAKSLCQWVHAIVRYHEVYQNVAPKKMKLNKNAAELDVSKKKLEQKRKELFDIEQKLNLLRKHYDEKKSEGIKLKNKIKDTKIRLQRAEKLISGLENEQEQWTIHKQEVIPIAY
jgi:dynein heavy chain